jgi:hypothetical protein
MAEEKEEVPASEPKKSDVATTYETKSDTSEDRRHGGRREGIDRRMRFSKTRLLDIALAFSKSAAEIVVMTEAPEGTPAEVRLSGRQLCDLLSCGYAYLEGGHRLDLPIVMDLQSGALHRHDAEGRPRNTDGWDTVG